MSKLIYPTIIGDYKYHIFWHIFPGIGNVDSFGTVDWHRKATAKSLLLTEGSANLLENIEHQQMLGANSPQQKAVDFFRVKNATEVGTWNWMVLGWCTGGCTGGCTGEIWIVKWPSDEFENMASKQWRLIPFRVVQVTSTTHNGHFLPFTTIHDCYVVSVVISTYAHIRKSARSISPLAISRGFGMRAVKNERCLTRQQNASPVCSIHIHLSRCRFDGRQDDFGEIGQSSWRRPSGSPSKSAGIHIQYNTIYIYNYIYICLESGMFFVWHVAACVYLRYKQGCYGLLAQGRFFLEKPTTWHMSLLFPSSHHKIYIYICT